MAASIMSATQRQRFKDAQEIDLAYSVPGLGPLPLQRVPAARHHRHGPPRHPVPVKTIDELGLPPVLKKIAEEERGLVLVTGTTGSGKSTTLAGMIDHINSTRSSHIITIEDPIEYLHKDNEAIINQREIGVDTRSFAYALRSALRQDPDVVLVGEMRDMETIETALHAAETGHLVFSTLHTLDATETINRIISVFPPHQQKQIRLQLAVVLKAAIAHAPGAPRRRHRAVSPAMEVLVATPFIKDCIIDKEKTHLIPDRDRPGHVAVRDADLRPVDLRPVLAQDSSPTTRRCAGPRNVDEFKLRSRASPPPRIRPGTRWPAPLFGKPAAPVRGARRSRGSGSSEPPDAYTAALVPARRSASSPDAQLRDRLAPPRLPSRRRRRRPRQRLTSRSHAGRPAGWRAPRRGSKPRFAAAGRPGSGSSSTPWASPPMSRRRRLTDAFHDVDEAALLDRAIERRLRGQPLADLDDRARARIIRGLVGQGFAVGAVLKKLSGPAGLEAAGELDGPSLLQTPSD